VRNMQDKIHQKKKSAAKLSGRSAMLKGCVRKQCATKFGGQNGSRALTKEARDGGALTEQIPSEPNSYAMRQAKCMSACLTGISLRQTKFGSSCFLSNQMQNTKHGKLAVQIYTQATMMWLAAHSAEFIVSSKEQIKQDPDSFWPEEAGEAIGDHWASYPGYGEISFEGDEEAAYLDPEHLPQIEVMVTERGIEFAAPEDVDEALRSQIVAASKRWIEEAQSQVTIVASEFARGRGIAAIRTMDLDIALSVDVEAEEPVNPAKDFKLVLMSVSFLEVRFQHMLGVVLRGTFHRWEVDDDEGGGGFTTNYYDANGRRYVSFSMYGQGANIEVY
jgi:hypothetical protein